MYYHLGQDVVTTDRDVIGVFDLDTSTVAKDTRVFLERAQRGGDITDVCDDIPKAFVLCHSSGRSRIYITQVSSATLRKRAQPNSWQV